MMQSGGSYMPYTGNYFYMQQQANSNYYYMQQQQQHVQEQWTRETAAEGQPPTPDFSPVTRPESRKGKIDGGMEQVGEGDGGGGV